MWNLIGCILSILWEVCEFVAIAAGFCYFMKYAVLKEEVLKTTSKLESMITENGLKDRPEYRNMMKFVRESTASLFPKDREDIRKIFNPDGENK
jgi:hypothetical protein